MLQTLRLGPIRIEGSGTLPPMLSPIVHAAESGSDLVPQIESLTRQFGFDSFTYRVATKLHPDEENRIFEFSTLSALWAINYDQKAYVEVDPRISSMWDSTIPMIWDQSIARACDPRAKAFLDDALAYGIASGVSIPLFDEVATRIVVDLVSKIPILERDRRRKIQRALGDMLVFGRYFHELFKRAAIEKRIPARNAGMPISPREWTCLALAAKGVAIKSIATQLRMDHRFVQTHFDSVRSKLEVTHLQHAIALINSDRLLA